MTTESTALTLPQRAQVALNSAQTEKDLQALAAASARIVAITNDDGYKECHAARMALVRARVEIQKTGKDAREDATKFSKAVIAEEARLIGIIEPEEKRLSAIQKAVDDEAERVRQERIEAERQRCEALQAQIANIAGLPPSVALKNAEQIRGALEFARKVVINHDTFAEFSERAQLALDNAVMKLNLMLIERTAFEAEQESLRIQREEQQAEAARLEAQRKEQERVAAVERERQADIARAQQAERDEAARIERERMAAEQRRIDQDKADLEAERQRLAKEREELELVAARPTPILSTDPVPAAPGLYIVTDPGDQPARLMKTEGDISPELKVAARDLHYTLIEQYGLKDDPVSNHAIREGLHQLMRLAATAEASRLDWAMRHIPGRVFSDLGVTYSAGPDRDAIDAAMEKANG